MVSRAALRLAKANGKPCLHAKAWGSPCTHKGSALLNFLRGNAEKSIKSSTAEMFSYGSKQREVAAWLGKSFLHFEALRPASGQERELQIAASSECRRVLLTRLMQGQG